ncbi:MAG: tyrosine-protein phosphatase [Bacilli bacterium]|nr:tyrosine-protein phosphatase [Bacilli bacterium]
MNKKPLLVSLLSLAMLVSCGTPTSSASSAPESKSENQGTSQAGTSLNSVSSSSTASSSSVVNHTHSFTNGSKNGALQTLTCSCGVAAYELATADCTEGIKNPNPSTKEDRLGKHATIKSDIWSIAGIAAGNYDVYVEGSCKDNDHEQPWKDAGQDRYVAKVDSGAEVGAIVSTESYESTGLSNGGSWNWTNTAIFNIDVPANAATLTLRGCDIGYAIFIRGLRLVGKTAGGQQGSSSSVPAESLPAGSGAFSNVKTFTAPIDNHTADQKAFIDYSGDYTTLTESQFRSTFHTENNSHQSDPTDTQLTWTHTKADGRTFSKYVAEFATDTAFTKDVMSFESTSASVNFNNLMIGTHYFYRVKALYTSGDPEISAVNQLDTAANNIRNLKVDGMTNCRDMGGKTTINGGKIKQGLIFRTGAPVDSQSQCNITAAGKKVLADQLGMKTEVELRELGFNSGTTSPVGSSVKFVHAAMEYQGGKNLMFRNIIPMIRTINLFADRNNYPIMFHCRIGTDRTGMIGLLLNALLGVSEHDIYQDYLFSNFGRIGKTSTCGQDNDDSTKGYIATLKTYPGANLQQKVYNFLATAGVPKANLDSIIDIMTEGTKGSMESSKIAQFDKDNLVLNGNSTFTGVATTSKSNARNPFNGGVKLNSSSKSIDFTVNPTAAGSASVYLTFVSTQTSMTLKNKFKVMLDTTEVTGVASNNFTTSDLGFATSPRNDYYTTCKLADLTVGAGSHTIKISIKDSTEISVAAVAFYK